MTQIFRLLKATWHEIIEPTEIWVGEVIYTSILQVQGDGWARRMFSRCSRAVKWQGEKLISVSCTCLWLSAIRRKHSSWNTSRASFTPWRPITCRVRGKQWREMTLACTVWGGPVYLRQKGTKCDGSHTGSHLCGPHSTTPPVTTSKLSPLLEREREGEGVL